MTQAGIEAKSNGADQRKKKKDICCLTCSSIDLPETAVLVVTSNMNVRVQSLGRSVRDLRHSLIAVAP